MADAGDGGWRLSATPLPRSTPRPERVREVLDLALERPAHERPAFVAGVCGDDERLRDEVDSLLTALDAGGDVLEPPAGATPAPATPLTGLSFGNYTVGERVGEGGMGVVYRAEDTRLGRTVAVKALPATLARDAHRRARFEHEARVLASLSHPNIAAIHGVEETARGPVLVLEFVPGQTLARRLDQGRLAVDEAVAIGVQIARGLEAAHAAGVVHRDLKPSNIQLTPEGSAKILDFGVAKQTQPRESGEPGHTMTGQLIGTAGYMSPEQARGRPVDRRTDLWALGCVLYEMLTGARAFDGETSSDTVAAVLRAEPDWGRLPPDTPAGVRRVLQRCLQKDPDQRQRDAGDVALELAGTTEDESFAPGRGGRAGILMIAAAVLMLGVVVVAIALRERAEPVARPAPIRFQLNLPPEQGVYVTPGGPMAFSPDGRTLVFSAGNVDRIRLCSRRMDSAEVVELAGSAGGCEPCFSPDGQWIAFRVDAQIRRIPAGGGGAEVLVRNGATSNGLAWGDDGIVFFGADPNDTAPTGPDWGLRRLRADGSSTQVIPLNYVSEHSLYHPEVLPGGDVILFTAAYARGDNVYPQVEAIRVSTGERRVIGPDAHGARFVPPNRLVFWQGGALMSAPFDVRSLRFTEAPSEVLRPLVGSDFVTALRFAVSRAGVLATLPGNILYLHTRLAWFNPDGGTWTNIIEGDLGMDAPRISPDGTRVSLLMGRVSGNVWVYNIERSTRTVLTAGDYHHHPVWTPDGKRLVYTEGFPLAQPRLQCALADASSPPETLWQGVQGLWMYATDFTPEGNLLLSIDDEGPDPSDLFVFDMKTRERPRRLMPTPATRYGARLSPDGSMVAYTSEETGSMQVYVQRYPSLEQKVPVSADRSYRPVWTGDGKKLFFRNVDRAMVVDVSRGPAGEIVLSTPRLVAEGLPDGRYDVDREGKRLLMGRAAGDPGPQTRIDVVVGWDPGRK